MRHHTSQMTAHGPHSAGGRSLRCAQARFWPACCWRLRRTAASLSLRRCGGLNARFWRGARRAGGQPLRRRCRVHLAWCVRRARDQRGVWAATGRLWRDPGCEHALWRCCRGRLWPAGRRLALWRWRCSSGWGIRCGRGADGLAHAAVPGDSRAGYHCWSQAQLPEHQCHGYVQGQERRGAALGGLSAQ